MVSYDDAELDDLVEKFGAFCELADPVKKDRTAFTSKACGKLVKSSLDKDYGKYEVSQRVDSSVLPKCMPKGAKAMTVNRDNVKLFIHTCAHEMAKKKKKNDKLGEDDPAVAECEQNIKECIRCNAPKISGTKTSKTGGVDRMTDASKYTGSHKERFDKETGKGKGKEGRVDIHANKGYTGQYKGEGTYDKRK